MNPYFLQHIPSKLRIPHKWRPFLIKHFPFALFPPHMSYEEYNVLIKYLIPGKVVYEFGSGGSTFLFLRKGMSVCSIESDIKYINFLKSFPVIKKKLNKRVLNLFHANIGETVSWGVPKDNSAIEQWPSYYKDVWDKYFAKRPNIIFIDGRFRVMCALYAVNYIDFNTIIIVHDFTKRESYNVLLEFFDLEEGIDTLVVLKLKKEISKERLEEVKNDYQFDFM